MRTKYFYILIFFLLASFTNPNQFDDQTHDYPSKKEAQRALEYYKKFLFRSNLVKFIAVTKNNDTGNFQLSIGTNGKMESRNIRTNNTYNGKFPSNVIPTKLPVPSSDSNKKYIKGLKISTFPIDLDSLTNLYNKNRAEFIQNIETTCFQEEWYDFPYGCIPVKRENSFPGTLGAIFELSDFPGRLFGISNWHVLCDKDSKLGDPVFFSDATGQNSIKVGKLFWRKFDDYREVAFVLFDNPEVENFLREKHQTKFLRTISTKGFPKKVFQKGMKSYSECDTEDSFDFYSDYAAINQYTVGDKTKNLHKQLLIDTMVNEGDSGSIIYNKDKNAIGLVFGGNKTPSIRHSSNEVKYLIYANKLEYIFNHTFETPQEILKTNNIDKIHQFQIK